MACREAPEVSETAAKSDVADVTADPEQSPTESPTPDRLTSLSGRKGHELHRIALTVNVH